MTGRIPPGRLGGIFSPRWDAVSFWSGYISRCACSMSRLIQEPALKHPMLTEAGIDDEASAGCGHLPAQMAA